MSRRTEEESGASSSSSSSTIGEDLLLITSACVDHPVEVQVRDGSVYSGIFYTANPHDGYGIILKNARLVRRGTLQSNFPSEGRLVDRDLVIHARDLVQLIVKDAVLTSDSVPNAPSSVSGEAVSVPTQSSLSSENRAVASEVVNQERQGVDRTQEERDIQGHPESSKEPPESNGSSPSLIGNHVEVNIQQERNEMIGSPDIKLMNHFRETHLPKEYVCVESVSSGVSDPIKPEANAAYGIMAVSAEMAPQNPLVNKTTKESKLNPAAKVFSPSIPNVRSTPPLVPTVPSMAYLPNSVPAVQVAAAQPEVGIRPIALRSWPIKVVPYVSSSPTNADSGLLYNQPIAGHIATRPQSIRHGTQYHPIQAITPYIHPNPQNAMFGRPAQVVYVHSIAHDMVQGPAALSQAPHAFLAPHPIHVAKHEGVLAGQPLPVSATPPLVADIPQPFAMPSQIQLSQPVFSSMLPIPVLSSNLPYVAKFP